MIKNVGEPDKIIRFLLAVVIGVAFYFNWVTGLGAFVLGILALILVVTSVVGNCPLYTLFGISTYDKL